MRQCLTALCYAGAPVQFGFLAVVFGTMMWMCIFGMVIKPNLSSEVPCEGYPDCVPKHWVEPVTTNGRL